MAAMSDADRLRQAAVEADRTAVYLHGTMTPTMHAVAALLRAIAHEAELFDGQRVTPQAVHWDSLMHLVAPALALANAILGEQT